ncbi:MAG TPA: LPS export ABC transporter ATP-binding protein [Alphaproteobacteria bacterium]|nr:LPS export ABC transporter ATP-binding protein [Alphaproteobacteria bacterium]
MTKRPIKKRVNTDNIGLEVRNLGKTYGNKAAVKDISFSLKPGEAIGLLGPNGAGKTTTFYMVMGLIKPDYGTISLYNSDITYLPMYRRARMGLGYLPQETSIFRGLTVEQNIMSILEITEPLAINRQNRLEELLSEFSVTHLRHVSAVSLSGGERRRVEIARALASNPMFMLLDEPLAGIDPIAVAEVRNLIAKLKDRGIGVLITDHNVRETLGIVDRAYIIHDGQVLEEGEPEKIVNSKIVKQVYLGEQFTM